MMEMFMFISIGDEEVKEEVTDTRQKVLNWLHDLAVGAKAQTQKMVCGECDTNSKFKVTASTYDSGKTDDIITVHVHNIKVVAEATGLKLMHRDFIEGDSYYSSFESEDFIMYEDVKFSNMNIRGGNKFV